MPLKNRQVQVPNGNRFHCPVTNYTANPYDSFNVICTNWAIAIRANMAKAKAAGLPMTMSDIQTRVDEYLSHICRQNGWFQYLQEVAQQQPPFPRSRPFNGLPPRHTPVQRVANIVVGSKTVVKWLASGAEAMPVELAEKRALVCAGCPVNSKNQPAMADKPLSHWFTVPAQAAIQVAVEKAKEMKLSTQFDDRLGVCEACSCPMRLKIWLPFERFYDDMTEQAKNDLDRDCWIRAEAVGYAPRPRRRS